MPLVWKWLSEAAGECGSAFYWGEVFPKCWVLERFCTVRRSWAWRNELSAWATLTLEKKVFCKQLCFPESSACWKSSLKGAPWECWPLRYPTREDHLGHSPRLLSINLHSLGREESGWSVLCLFVGKQGRSLGRWVRAHQTKGRESEEPQVTPLRRQDSNSKTRVGWPLCLGREDQQSAISWTSICGFFHLSTAATYSSHLSWCREELVEGMGTGRRLVLENHWWRRLIIFPWSRFAGVPRAKFPEIGVTPRSEQMVEEQCVIQRVVIRVKRTWVWTQILTLTTRHVTWMSSLSFRCFFVLYVEWKSQLYWPHNIVVRVMFSIVWSS